MRNLKIAIAMAVASAGLIVTAASGQSGLPGTVNAVSENEVARAKAAIQKAGYQPETLTMAQDHNLFFNATKGAESYAITVTPDMRAYVSTGVPANARS